MDRAQGGTTQSDHNTIVKETSSFIIISKGWRISENENI